MLRREDAIDRKLHHGDVGIRKHMDEWCPRAVVYAPGVVNHRVKLLDGKNGIAQFDTAADGIFHGKECLGKTIHIVDLRGLPGALYEVAVLVPMSRNHQNGFRTAIVTDDALPQRGERVGDVVVVEGEHRTAMAQEDGRHCFHVVSVLVEC